MSKIFGGSKSKGESSNQAFGQLNQTFSPMTQFGTEAGGLIRSLLGLGGGEAQTQGFDTFRNNTGYDFQMDEGTRAITGNAASKGLLGSGPTLKALTKFGQGLADSSFGSYMDRLFGLTNSGLQAGNLIAGAGQRSTSTNKSKPGLGGFVGGLASGFAGG